MAEKNNIWEQIIKEANTLKEIEEPHIFLFGDKNSGKRSLIKSINKDNFLNYEVEDKTLPLVDENVSKFSFLEYKYLNVKRTNDSENGKYFLFRNTRKNAFVAY